MTTRKNREETPVGECYRPPVAGRKERRCLGLGCGKTVVGDAGQRFCAKCRNSQARTSYRDDNEIGVVRHF